MQKSLTRLFMAVLMAALLVSASIMSVSAAEDHAGHATDWTPIGGESGQSAYISSGGHYYLTEDLSAEMKGNGSAWSGSLVINAGADTEVTVCMAGCSINPAETVETGLYIASGKVTLCNCSEQGGHIGVGTTRALSVGNNSSNGVDSTLTISGNVDMDGNGTSASPTTAYIFVVFKDGSLTLDNGSSVSNNYTSNTNGVVYTSGGTIVMKAGAEINKNVVAAGKKKGAVNVNSGIFTMDGGEISGNTGDYGAGVSVASGSFTMNGGTISENTTHASYTSGNGGAGVCFFGTTFTMTGGEIINNFATNNSNGGGGVYVGSSSTFNMSKGEISGNTALKGSGIAGTGDINLSGDAIITNDISLNGASGKVCSISENVSVNGALSIVEGKGSKFSLSGGKFSVMPDDTFVAAGYTAQKIADATGDDALQYEVVEKPVEMETVSACSVCGSGLGITEETLVELELLEGGNTYVLTASLAATNKLSVDGNVTLCLCGNTLTAPASATGSFITVNEGATLTICGGGDGVISGTGTSGLRGVEVTAGGTLELKSGTISGFSGNDYGSAVYLNNGATLTMSGGTISGNSAKYGVGVHATGASTITMSGGTVSGNTATNMTKNSGGGFCLFGTTEMTMSGGSITGNSTAATHGGGGVYVGGSATFKMEDGQNGKHGTVSGNYYAEGATDNGGSGVSAAGTITLSGNAEITNDVYIHGTKNGTISDNVAIVGALKQGSTGTFAISGGKFSQEITKESGWLVNGYDCVGNDNEVLKYQVVKGADTYNQWDMFYTTEYPVAGENGGTITAWALDGDKRGQQVEITYQSVVTGATTQSTESPTGYFFFVNSVTEDGQINELKTTSSYHFFNTVQKNVFIHEYYAGVTDGVMALAKPHNHAASSASNLGDCKWETYCSSSKEDAARSGGVDVAVTPTVIDVRADKTGYTDEISTWEALQTAAADKGVVISVYDDQNSETACVIFVVDVTEQEVDGCGDCGKGFPFTTQTNLTGGTYVLGTNTTAAGTITVTGNVTLCLCGNTLTAPAEATGNFITVNAGATLTICGGANGDGVITATEDTTGLRGIEVKANGTLILNSGTICGFTTTSFGGGVRFNEGGTFTMNGGTISYNKATYGAGVLVNNGTFKMYEGAVISYNETAGTYSGANGGGGVCLFGNTTMEMYGGEISNNTTMSGNQYGGGGVYGGASTTFIMTGGTISGNTSNSDPESTFDAAKGAALSIRGHSTVSGDATIEGTVLYRMAANGAEDRTASITGGTFNGEITKLIDDGATKDFTIAISGGTFTGMEKDALIEWLAADAPYVVTGESEYTVAVGFADGGEIVDFGSTLNLSLNLAGENGVTLFETFDDFDIAVSNDKYTAVKDQVMIEDLATDVVTIQGIAAKEIHDKFTVTITTKDGVECYERTLSIFDVINGLYEVQNDKDSAYANMLEDVVNYGIAAQTEFNYTVSTETLGDGSAKPTWEATEGIGWTGNVNVAVSLNLKDRIELNVYVQSPDAEATATLDNSEIDIRVSTSENESVDATTVTRFTIDTIDVVNAKKELVIAITDSAANPIGTLTYSIVDYVLANTSQPELMDALAKYMESVATVIGGNNQ